MDKTESETDKGPVKLKFGIDRLLSSEPCSIRVSVSRAPSSILVAKPFPTVAVPCSDCVTSLFRCCRLSPANPRHEQGYLGQSHGSFASLPSSSTTYTVQPIKPFPTRPSKYCIT